MSDQGSTTVRIRRCLERLGARDASARSELLEHARRRLSLLAARMFARFPLLHPRVQVDDLCQEAMLRLWTSLEEVGPTTVADFMGLAALQIRRSLRDLARNHFGRNPDTGAGWNPRPYVDPARAGEVDDQLAGNSWAPEELACWSEFHAAADRLPEPLRTAFDLLYYHELSQAEAAEVMQVSERQLRRYWQSARLELQQMLEGFLPE